MRRSSGSGGAFLHPLRTGALTVAREGQQVLLLGKDRKRFILRLQSGQRLQTHHGILYYDDLIGLPLGTLVRSHLGYQCHLLTPSLDDFSVELPRPGPRCPPWQWFLKVYSADRQPGHPVAVRAGALALCSDRGRGIPLARLQGNSRPPAADGSHGCPHRLSYLRSRCDPRRTRRRATRFQTETRGWFVLPPSRRSLEKDWRLFVVCLLADHLYLTDLRESHV